MSPPVPTPTIDHGVAFANNVYLFGWSYPKPEPVSVTFVDGRGLRTQLTIFTFGNYPRPDVREALRHKASAKDDQFGFVAVIDLADLIGLGMYDSEVDISVDFKDGSVASAKLNIQRANLEGRTQSDSYNLVELAAGLGLLDRRLANFVGGMNGEGGQFATSYAIDAACRSNSGFITEGWIENARSRNLSFLSSDGLSFVAAADVIFKSRPDVSNHLRGEKCPVLTEDHGVLLNFPHSLTGTDSFIILAENRDGFSAIAEIKVKFSEERNRLLQVASYAAGAGKLPHPQQAKKLFRPFFVDSRKADEFSVTWIKTLSSRPKTTIIVPLFREYRFIFSLLTMQKRFSSDFEWLFISDDPAQHQILGQILEKRSDSLACSTALVLNRFNYGYAESNNIGASIARGDTLLFMNSDIWIDSARPIVNAAKALDTDRYQIIGFRLLYEDGTIQHDGMSFRRSALLHNLFIVVHSKKGTPPDQESEKIVEVPAVTGALLMIKKDQFLKVGRFDRAYIKGDFEDADLCLKVRVGNGRVGLYKTDGIYHLERQSIRLMDSDSSRMALTYLNCITFNERWAKQISPPQSKLEAALPQVAVRGRRKKQMEA